MGLGVYSVQSRVEYSTASDLIVCVLGENAATAWVEEVKDVRGEDLRSIVWRVGDAFKDVKH